MRALQNDTTHNDSSPTLSHIHTEHPAKQRVPTPLVTPLPQIRPTTPAPQNHALPNALPNTIAEQPSDDGWRLIQKTYSTKSARVLSPQPPNPPETTVEGANQADIHVHNTDFVLTSDNEPLVDPPALPSQPSAMPAFVNIDGGEVLALGDADDATAGGQEDDGMGLEVGPSVQVGRDAEQLTFLDT